MQNQLSYRRTAYMPDMDSAFRIFETHWRITKPFWSRPLHDHPIFELNVLLDGVQDVQIGDKVVEMQTGDVLIIEPGVPHRVIGTRGRAITYFALHFDLEDYMFRGILSQSRSGLHRYGTESEVSFRKPLHDLIELVKQSEHEDLAHPAPRLKLMSLAFDLFAALSRVDTAETPPKDIQMVACRMADQIEKAGKAGDSGTAALDLRIAQLAEKLGYSRSYLCRVFRSVYGMSPRKYLSNITLHRARLELLNPRQSMEQIAEKLGFIDGAHFSKQFKRWTGASPSEYRQLQRNLIQAES